MASERAFAFGAMLTREREAAAGRISFSPFTGDTGDDTCPALGVFADALAEHLPLAWNGAGGKWSLKWR